jgi:HemY protein
MRSLFWTLGIAAAAVGLVLAARFNTGNVILVFPDVRVELSLNLALLLLAAGFLAGYMLLRGLFLAVDMPRQVRLFHERRRRKAGREAFEDALRSYFEGRYGKAEKAAAAALEAGESPALSAVIAARAAHQMRAFDARDRYLARAEGTDPQSDYLRRITRAELLLEERRYHDALATLSQLGDRHTAALRLELRAHQMARNWERVLSLLPQLEKRRVLDPPVLAQLRRTATVEALKRKALDAGQLREAWDRLPADLKRDTQVARAAAACYAELGNCAEAHRVIEVALEEQWDSQLVAAYSECPGPDTREQIQKAERWLPAHPRDAALLLTLGRLCAHEGLWGKAKSYFEASLAVEPTHTVHLELAKLAEHTGRDEEAAPHYRAALDLALAQVRGASGGRRKTLL